MVSVCVRVVSYGVPLWFPVVFPVVLIVILTFLVVFGTHCVSFPFFSLLA